MPMDIGLIIDVIIFGLLFFSIIRGWHVGFVIKIGHVVALIAAGICAGVIGEFCKKVVGIYVIMPVFKEKIEVSVVSAELVEKSVEAVCQNLAYYLVYAISFIILIIVFMKLVNLLKIVDKIPVIGTLNKIGGLLAGFVAEVIVLYLVGMILFGLFPMSMWNDLGLTREVIEGTMFLKRFVP